MALSRVKRAVLTMPDETVKHMLMLYKKDLEAPPKAPYTDTDPTKSAYEKLNAMVGLHEVKATVDAIIAYNRLRLIAKERGHTIPRQVFHMMFTGNPGTGKTSIARLLSDVFFENGILKTKTFRECSRSQIISDHIGGTAPLIDQLFAEVAITGGGVIFIDEAYSLFEDDHKGFAFEAITQLIKNIELYSDKIIVIMAGYEEEMDKLLSMNAGLKSRIPFHVVFHDYSKDEMIEIAQYIAHDKGFTISAEAIHQLELIIDEEANTPRFGNGRFIKNLIEKAILNKALSLNNNEELVKMTDEALFTLTQNDFIHEHKPKTTEKRIGFV